MNFNPQTFQTALTARLEKRRIDARRRLLKALTIEQLRTMTGEYLADRAHCEAVILADWKSEDIRTELNSTIKWAE